MFTFHNIFFLTYAWFSRFLVPIKYEPKVDVFRPASENVRVRGKNDKRKNKEKRNKTKEGAKKAVNV